MSEYAGEELYDYRRRSLDRKESLYGIYQSLKHKEKILRWNVATAAFAPIIGAVALIETADLKSDWTKVPTVLGAVYLSIIGGITTFAGAEQYSSNAHQAAREGAQISSELDIAPERWITDELQ